MKEWTCLSRVTWGSLLSCPSLSALDSGWIERLFLSEFGNRDWPTGLAPSPAATTSTASSIRTDGTSSSSTSETNALSLIPASETETERARGVASEVRLASGSP